MEQPSRRRPEFFALRSELFEHIDGLRTPPGRIDGASHDSSVVAVYGSDITSIAYLNGQACSGELDTDRGGDTRGTAHLACKGHQYGELW